MRLGELAVAWVLIVSQEVGETMALQLHGF
jgi:hypothetical protein